MLKAFIAAAIAAMVIKVLPALIRNGAVRRNAPEIDERIAREQNNKRAEKQLYCQAEQCDRSNLSSRLPIKVVTAAMKIRRQSTTVDGRANPVIVNTESNARPADERYSTGVLLADAVRTVE